MTNYPQGYGAPRPPKQGMSTGAKLALGCGIPTVLGLLAREWRGGAVA